MRVARRPQGGCALGSGRLIMAIAIAAIALIGYFSSRSFNDITGETQHISITKEQEVALGLQAAPQMAQEFGGLSPDQAGQSAVDSVCRQLITTTDVAKSDYPFECHLLADQETVNAFALPGGQVFITQALYDRLETEGQLAGVLGHEVGHVVGRHGAEHIAKQQLTEGLTGAVVVAASDPNDPQHSQYAAQLAILVGQLVNMKYGRDDELESDRLGVRFMTQAGYDPNSLVRVMEILEAASQGPRPPEFFSTHPNPGNRIEKIKQDIATEYPDGLPAGLKP